MGCGSSSAAAAANTLAKDKDDFSLEPIEFQKMKVPKFDDFLASVQAPVNNVVEITTIINDCIDDIKDVSAMVLGNYLVEIDLNATSHDAFHVQINKVPANPPPNPPLTADQLHEELQKIVTGDKFKAAEKALSDARAALYAAKATFTLGAAGTPDEGKLLGEGTADANKALADMREALGAGYKLGITLKASPLQGARTVGARIVKAVAPSDDSAEYKMQPVASYDVYKSKEAKAIISSQILIDEAAGLLAKRLKAADDAGVKYTLELLNKRRVKLVVEAPEGEAAAPAEGGEEGAAPAAAPAPEKQEVIELRRAVLVLNHQLFKLQKAAGAANGPVNLGKAISIMLTSIINKAKKLAGDNITNLIKFNPKFNMSMTGEIDFDFDVGVNVPGYEDKPWTEFMPAPAKLIYDAIMRLKDKLVESFPKFKELAGQVETLIEKAGEAFGEPMDTIKEAIPDIGMMELGKMAKSAMDNLVKVKDCAKVVQVFLQTAKRVGGELSDGIDAAKALVK